MHISSKKIVATTKKCFKKHGFNVERNASGFLIRSARVFILCLDMYVLFGDCYSNSYLCTVPI